MISNTYLENLNKFPDVDVIILGDLNAIWPGPGRNSTASGSGVPPMTC